MSADSPVAIVTGASAGIGLAVAEAMVARGMRVVMLARSKGPLEREAARLGPLAIAWPLDVGDLEAAARLPGEVHARFGRLDALVNNAGLHNRGDVMTQSAASLAAMVNVNLSSPIVMCRATAPLLPPGGALINVASLAGMVPLQGAATYSATKAGLRFFTRAFAAEQPHLRISTVSPGPVDTPFLSDIEHVHVMVFSQPMSTAAEVAAVVMRCLEIPSTELVIPWASGKLTTLGYLAPALTRALRPMMERRGAKAKEKYKAKLLSRNS